ncbi:MAG: hypothetical protein HXX15_10845 [Rhodopseudomonas sp.]|uniref:hypothetical protein n=1 Tax=Rhodopseudomonas sp. TaxID=1078 RepID=UPI0017FB98D8|nr:hypothetical protein [Rhodopseudomonas sp.]NVN86572.1 hypothetical protein [Rhodopseudomonas sp.]
MPNNAGNITAFCSNQQLSATSAGGGLKGRFSPAGLLASLAMAFVVGAVGLVLADNANAAPLSPGKAGLQGDLIKVRDGCGPGMRFSHSRDTCVEDSRRRDDFRDDRRFRDERRFRDDRPRRDDDGAAAGRGGDRFRNDNNRRDGDRGNRGRLDKRDFGTDGQDD